MSQTIVETGHIIIGTAGHIDHGKTALVKALTGIDADTLPEEKKRGITIELGFIFMETPGVDRQIVFIDVPGHEKLVKTMVAGASNIDAALLVIAADDGVSAQTVEHFDILRLLGIESGIVALTKIDLVDSERVRAVAEDVKSLVAGTFMSDAPVIPVSSVTGAGVEEVRSTLFSIGQCVRKRRDSGIFRMPIDRVFTMPGFGVVIAGTILSGQVGVGDRVEIFPEGISARVRGIQVHSQSREESSIGRRTAINVQDVRKEQLRRGQCAAAPGSLSPTFRLDARLHFLKSASKELRNRSRLRLHVQTDEVICRVVLLDREVLLPGEAGLVQLMLESPTVALPKNRFIVRTFSPMQTIGGGQILDASPRRHKRFDLSAVEGLEKLEGSLVDIVEQTFLNAGFEPKGLSALAASIGAKENEVRSAVQELLQSGKLVKIAGGGSGTGRSVSEDRYLHVRPYDELTAKLVDLLKDYFGKNPYKLLMPLADLQSRFLKIAERQIFEGIIDDLCKKKTIYKKNSRMGLVGHEIKLRHGEQVLADEIEGIFREARFSPPLEEDVRKQIGAEPGAFTNLVDSLIERGCLVRLSDKVTYHSECVQAARGIVLEHIRKNGSITVAELRDKLGVSRKYALALLEHFDNIGLTRREGDKHVVR